MPPDDHPRSPRPPDQTPGGGYLPLATFGIAPIAGSATRRSRTSPCRRSLRGARLQPARRRLDGYVVIGGGTGQDVDFEAAPIPSTNRPNNIVAPLWTDLNPAAGGALRIGILTDGVQSWIVVDYRQWSSGTPRSRNTFQVWVGVDGIDDVTIAHGTVATPPSG